MIRRPGAVSLGALPILILVIVALSGGSSLSAQCSIAELATPGAAAEDFAGPVAISGDLAVVGAPGHDVAATDAGRALVYQRVGNQWPFLAELLASDAAPSARFGLTVAADQGWIAVGAPFDTDGRGAVYMFQLVSGNWTEVAKLTANDGLSGDRFGDSIDVDGDVIFVGAPERDENGGGSGAAYVFEFDGTDWTEAMKLLPPEVEVGDSFGFSVAVNGLRALVGARGDDDGASNAGAAYAYLHNGFAWVNTEKLVGSDALQNDRFGHALDLDGDLAIIGAPFNDDLVFASGAAYSFRWESGGWLEEAKFTATDTGTTDEFSFSVAVDGNLAVIGALLDDDLGSASGSTYLYRRQGTSWLEEDKFVAPDGAQDDNLGRWVALSDGVALAGARQHDEGAADTGAAYVFRVEVASDCNGNGVDDLCELDDGSASDCNCNGTPDACDIASGTSLDLDGDGVPDECDEDCNGNGLADGCELLLGLASDCNDNGVLDECDITAATSTDCNNNGVPDECDVGVALILDCNSNGVLDPCEIVSGDCLDCNGNGIPDDCDIEGGTSLDLDGDQVPDECESEFVRGDTNGDGALELVDALVAVNYLFIPGSTVPSCIAAVDANGDDLLDISDPLTLVLYLFLQGTPPATPFPGCGTGVDPSACLPCLGQPFCP